MEKFMFVGISGSKKWLLEVNNFASKLLASAHSLVATIPRPATVIAAVAVSAVSLVANALSPPPPQRHSTTTRTV
ncbi:hypothetical protein CRE_03676 [Caenorhabditis remanei]|uniref:Uncharacterized protein n=1 Tax=Caenorhabditis remanei TaxID=31234 RepID=E3LXM6_CAERE|nr:hypothetical protein CRE_03676 [Caenorhabditis remanei]